MGQISCSILSKDTLIFNQQTTHLLLFHRSMCVPSTKVPQPSSIFMHFWKSPSKIVNCLILITRIKETLSPSAVHPVCLSALRQWMIVCQRVSVSYRSLRTLCNWAIVTPPVLSVCVCVCSPSTLYQLCLGPHISRSILPTPCWLLTFPSAASYDSTFPFFNTPLSAPVTLSLRAVSPLSPPASPRC